MIGGLVQIASLRLFLILLAMVASLAGLPLVVHEDAAFLKCAQFQVFSCFGVQLQQFLELISVQIHRQGLVLFRFHLFFILERWGVGLVTYVALQLEQEGVFIEHRVAGQLHKLLSVLVEHIYKT